MDSQTPEANACRTKCDGYAPQSVTKDDGASSSLSLTVVSGSVGSIPSALADRPLEDEERRIFARYQFRTARELASFDDDYFWEIVLPRATHHEPSVFHAIIALSALHERFGRADPLMHRSWADDEDSFALKHYNKAIQCLVNPNEGQQKPIDVCLINCILFACIEVGDP